MHCVELLQVDRGKCRDLLNVIGGVLLLLLLSNVLSTPNYRLEHVLHGVKPVYSLQLLLSFLSRLLLLWFEDGRGRLLLACEVVREAFGELSPVIRLNRAGFLFLHHTGQREGYFFFLLG